ncbi:MAG: RidA family protein [Verrucomicrobiae bacterium]|nr:RidA family protein [Verrucomicrobiae bacterium]
MKLATVSNSIALLVFVCSKLSTGAGEIRHLQVADNVLRLVAVERAALVHTAQVTGEPGTVEREMESALDQLSQLLGEAGSSLSSVVKINAYVREDALSVSLESAIDRRFDSGDRPAVSFVTTPLPCTDCRVALDAVAAVEDPNAGATAPSDSSRKFAILPVGPRVYISGQAEKGEGSLGPATRATLESLGRTLDFLGLETSDVVQVKSFLTPMSEHSVAEREIATFFGGVAVPPSVFVEWQSSLPIEIEMIVAAPGLEMGPAVEVRTPPGMTTPAVYSRLTIARHPVTVYTDGLFPEDPAASPESQLRSLFRRLKQGLDLAGSDWMHLVKATYYVSDDELSREHNLVRPDYFSPRRPPAASKASVAGAGRPEHGITMDFIVVPGEP